jgi:pimeloyl-ACP methyl ester carboxylesterase
MRSIDLCIDVATATGLEGDVSVAATLHLPQSLPVDAPVELYVAVHGGGHTRGYWHLDYAGFPGYSYAEFVTGQGRALLAIDLLGMGGSTQPQPETLLSRLKVAAASHHVTSWVARGLQDGIWARAPRVVITGIGHSIGGMMVITQQAEHRSFERLAVLGWANQRLVLGGMDPADLAASIEPGYLAAPRQEMRPFFYGPDVPLGLIEVDEAHCSLTPACLGRDALLPGIVHAAAASITTPVFLMYGSTDTSPDPINEVPFFRSSPDVTLMVLADTAHCHNLARRRRVLWNRFEGWVNGLPV